MSLEGIQMSPRSHVWFDKNHFSLCTNLSASANTTVSGPSQGREVFISQGCNAAAWRHWNTVGVLRAGLWWLPGAAGQRPALGSGFCNDHYFFFCRAKDTFQRITPYLFKQKWRALYFFPIYFSTFFLVDCYFSNELSLCFLCLSTGDSGHMAIRIMSKYSASCLYPNWSCHWIAMKNNSVHSTVQIGKLASKYVSVSCCSRTLTGWI